MHMDSNISPTTDHWYYDNLKQRIFNMHYYKLNYLIFILVSVHLYCLLFLNVVFLHGYDLPPRFCCVCQQVTLCIREKYMQPAFFSMIFLHAILHILIFSIVVAILQVLQQSFVQTQQHSFAVSSNWLLPRCTIIYLCHVLYTKIPYSSYFVRSQKVYRGKW